MTSGTNIETILGKEASYLLDYQCSSIPKERIHPPHSQWVDTLAQTSDRSPRVLANLQRLLSSGRLAHTGYLSILPVDQGVEHSAGASFTKNPDYFDPAHICKLALEAGCSGVASSFGALSLCARSYAHKIPFIVKVNHNELLSFPHVFDQTVFGSLRRAQEMGAAAIGATIYFGSPQSKRQIEEIGSLFSRAHQLGMATILWCYLRNDAFHSQGKDYHNSADLTAQANHLGVSLGADIIKQKLPEHNGGYKALQQAHGSFGKMDSQMYTKLCGDHPIDLARLQVLHCYSGKIGLINSGGPSGEDDLAQAVRTAVINKRAGGMGLICGRKAFQKPLKEGISLLHHIQDVYLDDAISLA